MPVQYMVAINVTDQDDPQFVEFVTRILGAAVKLYRPSEIYILQIDHWFDHKWKTFSGKVLGALGVWKLQLTLPPFTPNRVLSQIYYEAESCGAATYTLKSALPLHIDQWSDANMQRFVHRISRNGIFFWYSGGTKASDAASVMLYHVKGGEAAGWYASFKKKEAWKLNKVEGISRREFSVMLEMLPSPHGI